MILEKEQKILADNIETAEHRLLTRSGEIRWVFTHGSPVFMNDIIVGFQGIITDITQIKLLRDQLNRSEKWASSGQLAACIAHEINSPLQGICSLLSLLKKNYAHEEELMTDLDLLDKAFENIRNITKNLLNLNRPGKEKKQPVNVNDVIEDTAALVRGHLKKKRFQLGLNLCSKPLVVTASPQQLGQVLMNLINNAVEAIRGESDNGGEISISTSFDENDIVIKVSDNGPGIPAEVLPRIFEPFYTCKKNMGMGVGLSICHDIIEDHKGTIVAENSPEGGAVFTITLPVCEHYMGG